MGNHKAKHEAKVLQQRVNKAENELYYQHGTDQKTPRTESKIREHRTLAKT